MDRDQLNRILFSLLGCNSTVNLWWKSPNKEFDMSKPEDVWVNDPKRVEDYIVFYATVK